MAFELKRAKRTVQKARIAISGPSGSGKTKSALRLARGLVEAEAPESVKADVSDDQIRIVVLDTEQRSSELYDDVVPFAPYHLEAPYSPERYIAALNEIERVKPLVIIIDQASHAWAGKGGLLEFVEQQKQTAKNEFMAWGKATPKQNAFVERILECRCHVIVTLRSKAEYVLEEQTNRQGKRVQVPKKVGMAPIQRDGFEYEFMSMFDLDRDTHHARLSKDRTSIFPEDETFLLDENWGRKLHAWLTSAPEPEMPVGGPAPWEDEKPENPAPKAPLPKQRGKTADTLLQAIGSLFSENGLAGRDPQVMEEKLGILRKVFGTSNWAEICEMPVENLREGKTILEAMLVQRTQPGDETIPFGDDTPPAAMDMRNHEK